MSDGSILLIEDARASSGPAARALEQLRNRSYDVVRAGTLAEGLAQLPERRFAAVILDLDLPDGKGMPAFLRFQSKADTVPIVVLVDRAEEDLGVETARRGAHD
jgi:DNA-binding response OmpR family regulator